MRLNAEAIICTSKREWYYGYLDGFAFSVKDKIKDKNQIQNLEDFRTVSKWLKSIGYKWSYDRLAKTLLKSITIYDSRPGTQGVSLGIEKGVLKLFIGTTAMVGTYESDKWNVLCANCVWTCKQAKNSYIHTCKAFKNGKPAK